MRARTEATSTANGRRMMPNDSWPIPTDGQLDIGGSQSDSGVSSSASKILFKVVFQPSNNFRSQNVPVRRQSRTGDVLR